MIYSPQNDMEILIVDDERAMRNTLKTLLSEEGYAVRVAANGARAIEMVGEARPDLVLLDVMMPGMNGYAVCRALREREASLPILFLTALDSEQDELRGLNLGGDDFVSKTVSDGVLLARIASVLRRTRKQDDRDPACTFAFGAWQVNPLAHVMTCGKATVELSLREVEMLRWFGAHPNEIFSHDALLTRFWGVDYDGGISALHMQMKRLRAKLGPDGALLVSVRGEGYAMRP